MSGGSMDYLSWRVEEAKFSENTPLRRAFRKHLNLVAACLHSIEWNDSGDGDRSEDARLLEVLGDHSELKQLMVEARSAAVLLNEALEKAEHKQSERLMKHADSKTEGESNETVREVRESGCEGDDAAAADPGASSGLGSA